MLILAYRWEGWRITNQTHFDPRLLYLFINCWFKSINSTIPESLIHSVLHLQPIYLHLLLLYLYLFYYLFLWATYHKSKSSTWGINLVLFLKVYISIITFIHAFTFSRRGLFIYFPMINSLTSTESHLYSV